MALSFEFAQIDNGELNHTLQQMNVIRLPATPGHRAIPIHVICQHLNIAFPLVTTVEGSGRFSLPQPLAICCQILKLKLAVVWWDFAPMSKGEVIRRSFLPKKARRSCYFFMLIQIGGINKRITAAAAGANVICEINH